MLAHLAFAGADTNELDTWYIIGKRESHCSLSAHNFNPRTRDDSYCWGQINYYGSLRGFRTAAFGNAADLLVDPWKCAAAMVGLRNQVGNFSPWRL